MDTIWKNLAFDAKHVLEHAPMQTGVYQMFDDQDNLLYVGKARHLKQRLASYFKQQTLSPKTQLLVKQITRVEITLTATEREALLLESNLIKHAKPRYNIVFRDDKSYPYIYLSQQDDFPRLSLYRGKKKEQGCYFGPYPNVNSVHQTLHLLQKLFQLRTCSQHFFAHRSRPCLQYQIKRCSAPCVGLIDQKHYQESLRHAILFLEGKSQTIIDEFSHAMEKASEALDFERAAQYRDHIIHLRNIQARQVMSQGNGNLDVMAIAIDNDIACIDVVTIRSGDVVGNRSFFLNSSAKTIIDEPNDLLAAFISQYYTNQNHSIPDVILTQYPIDDVDYLIACLSQQRGKKVYIKSHVRQIRAKWIELAQHNANLALQHYLTDKMTVYQRFLALQHTLDLSYMPERLECFDVSHIHGEATMASCVVFNQQGPLPKDYRRFSIRNVKASDDYAAMYQALSRHYKRLQEEDGVFPDILCIDGGKGQLTQAHRVLEELQIDGILILGIAKGSGRQVGLESIIRRDHQTLHLNPHDPALLLMQAIRDEAHRFAITGHRQQRDKKRFVSKLEHIDGIGAKRCQQLLHHFGSLDMIRQSDVQSLTKIKGISRTLAEKILETLRDRED